MSDSPTASPVVLGRWEKPGNLAALAALAAAGQVTILPHELIRTTDGRVYHWTGTALEVVSAPVHHGIVADVAALDGVYLLPSCTRGVHQGDTAYVTAAACEYRVASGVNATATWAACASIPSIPTTPSEVGADPAGTAESAVSAHNTATNSHADIRTLVGDRVPISTTRLGTVGSVPLTTTALTAADWAALPVGWSGIISADVAVASGLPAADVYHLQKVSNRDVSGGGAYQAQGYLTPTLYVGVAATSADIPTWSVALTSAPGTTVSYVGSSLLALATPTAQKIPRIDSDGSVTLIDVPSGGGGGSIAEVMPGPQTAEYTYAFGGDANGVIAALVAGGAPPSLSTSGSVGGGTLLDLIDRAADDIYISGAVGTWVQFDFGADCVVAPNYFTIRNNHNNYDPLRNWEWRGSNDLTTWTVLDTRVSDTTLSAASVWGGWSPNGELGGSYRYLRLVRTGATGGGGAAYIRIGEIEVYGAVTMPLLLPAWATVWLSDGAYVWAGWPV